MSCIWQRLPDGLVPLPLCVFGQGFLGFSMGNRPPYVLWVPIYGRVV